MFPAAEIAKVAHEANKAYCETLGDFSQVSWHYAEQWQRNSAMNGVLAIEKGTVTKPEHSHENWLKEKEEQGWVYGEKKNTDASVGVLTHPCMVPFNELPAEQQMKDHLFFAIVTVLLERT